MRGVFYVLLSCFRVQKKSSKKKETTVWLDCIEMKFSRAVMLNLIGSNPIVHLSGGVLWSTLIIS